MTIYNNYKVKVQDPESHLWVSYARHLSYNEAQASADILKIVGYNVRTYPLTRI